MKLIITTLVWYGEYDPSEFSEGHKVVSHTWDNNLEVIEEREFEPARTTISFKP